MTPIRRKSRVSFCGQCGRRSALVCVDVRSADTSLANAFVLLLFDRLPDPGTPAPIVRTYAGCLEEESMKKQCPQCGNLYTDDNQFCHEDGSLLVFPGSNPAPFSGDTPTVVVQRPVNQFSQPASQPTQPRSVGMWIFALFGLMLGLIVILAFLAFYPRERKEASTETNRPQADQNNEGKAVPSTPATPAPTPISKPSVPSVRPVPAVRRMKFNKGEITHSENGTISAEGTLTYVLKCARGQTLSASVASPNSCVRFDTDAASLSYVTNAGDNRIVLFNSCASPNSFNIAVTIR